ncbi:MAG: membrane protein insertion efficiency factor YidD [candidate division WOR-3 bacterium]
MACLLITLIRIYQYTIGNLLPRSCRFQPSCSQYALESLRLHGTVRGILLALRRLLRCHPFSAEGYDPVPEPKNQPSLHV